MSLNSDALMYSLRGREEMINDSKEENINDSKGNDGTTNEDSGRSEGSHSEPKECRDEQDLREDSCASDCENIRTSTTPDCNSSRIEVIMGVSHININNSARVSRDLPNPSAAESPHGDRFEQLYRQGTQTLISKRALCYIQEIQASKKTIMLEQHWRENRERKKLKWAKSSPASCAKRLYAQSTQKQIDGKQRRYELERAREERKNNERGVGLGAPNRNPIPKFIVLV